MPLKKKFIIATLIFIIAATAAAVVLFARRSEAIIPLPFGGQILDVTYCSCSDNVLLKVGPPVPGNYIYQPGATILYEFGQVFRPGPWVLGLQEPGVGVCLVAGKGCSLKPSTGAILEVGTSI